jgi:NAD(P)-dependent dehydrogenase (short-subunit alcohol dehydrogenase family)
MRLENKVVLITGGGSGFGRQCSLLFAQEGAKVLLTDVDGDRADAAAQWVNEGSGGENAKPMTLDVTKEEDVAAGVKEAESGFGKLDIMFANAGIVSRGGVPQVMGGEEVEFEDLTDEDWQNVLAVNLTGVFYCAKHAVPAMKRNGGGTILATSSAASMVGYPNAALYAASKGGINALVKGLSWDLGKYGIRVNAICPTHGMSPNFLMPPGSPVVGKSYEEMAAEMDGAGWDPDASPIPLKLDRPPSLEDNARVALFLASDESKYMSGICLPSTDGGTLSRVSIIFEGIDVEAPEPAAAATD